ncbi:MAG: CAP domain-containing protein [Thermodesulfobacteriota bacterium]
MRNHILVSLLLMLILALPASALAGPAAPRRDGQPSLDVTRLEKRIHDLVNRERKKAGLPALAWNPTLQRIARNYSREMANRGFFSHTGPDGRDFSERYRHAGFDCVIRTSGTSTCLGGENLAMNALYRSISWRDGRQQTDWNSEEQIAASVVRQWMTSPGHRRNILTRHYQRQGIGVAVDQDGRVLVTENFC